MRPKVLYVDFSDAALVINLSLLYKNTIKAPYRLLKYIFCQKCARVSKVCVLVRVVCKSIN